MSKCNSIEYNSIETIYYQRNRDVILKRARDYYKNNKKVLKERAKNKYRELSEEDKNIKRDYGRNTYKICLKKTKKN